MADYEIIGETIKSATSIKIGEIFKVATIKDGQTVYTYPTRYKENISKPSYPNYSIVQVGSPSVTRIGRNRYSLDYLINVQYRVAENTESVTNLQQQLDNMALQLSMYLTELNLGWPTKTFNRRSEKVDGVLQFFFNITVYAKMEEGQLVLMRYLTLNEEVI